VPSCSPRPNADQYPDAHSPDASSQETADETAAGGPKEDIPITPDCNADVGRTCDLFTVIVLEAKISSWAHRVLCGVGLRCVDRSGKLQHYGSQSVRAQLINPSVEKIMTCVMRQAALAAQLLFDGMKGA
jgi:hypothetical protein